MDTIAKFFKVISLTLISTNAFADESKDFEEDALVPPACVDARGKEVIYFRDSFRNVVSAGGLFAFATIENDKPYIVYETEFLGQFPLAFQEMALAHECAHHVNGDLYQVIEQGADNIQISVEDRADCDAVKFLVNNKNYGEKEISDIVNTWKRMISMAKQQSPSSVPYIEDKPEKIQACYQRLIN